MHMLSLCSHVLLRVHSVPLKPFWMPVSTVSKMCCLLLNEGYKQQNHAWILIAYEAMPWLAVLHGSCKKACHKKANFINNVFYKVSGVWFCSASLQSGRAFQWKQSDSPEVWDKKTRELCDMKCISLQDLFHHINCRSEFSLSYL